MSARAIVLTSTFLRHRFLVNHLASRLEVAGVWQEEKTFRPGRSASSGADEAVIAEHFAARDASERSYFSGHETRRLACGAVLREVGPSGCNDGTEASLMASLSPDVVIVFGTGILRDEILRRFSGRILNLHLGLSPYYRGAGTNFWPLVNHEPEYVGATIHYVDAGIDSGPIVAHVRPNIRIGDGPHDIGNRTIVAAAEVLARAAAAHVEGGLQQTPQAAPGRLYHRKEFTADAVRRLYHNLATGMIEEYLQRKRERDAKLSLISLRSAREEAIPQ